MKLSNKTRYGVRALFDIAYHNSGRPTQARDIARRQQVPVRYLEQIFQELRRARLVEAKRGPRGGYFLGRSPESLTIGDVVRAVQGPSFAVNLDTGNFHGPDPYAEVAAAAPYAVNVQIKTEIRRKGGSKEPADMARIVDILCRAKYSGYVVLEYNASEDPKTAVPRHVKELRSLISGSRTAARIPSRPGAATGEPR